MTVQTLFSSTRIYAKHHLLARRPRQPWHSAGNRTPVRIIGAVNLGIILAVVPVKRKRRLILASTSAAFANRITPCFTAPNKGILFHQYFDTTLHRHTLLPSMQPRIYQWTMIYRTLAHARKLLMRMNRAICLIPKLGRISPVLLGEPPENLDRRLWCTN